MVVKVEVFTSLSCPYCPMAVQVVEEVEKEMPNDLEVEKIDIMVDREKAIEYGLMAVSDRGTSAKGKILTGRRSVRLKRSIGSSTRSRNSATTR